MSTSVTRFILKRIDGDKYLSDPIPIFKRGIWNANLFKEKPSNLLTLFPDCKLQLVTVTFQEILYEVE